MTQTIEVTIDEKGVVHLTEALKLKSVHRALLTVLDEPPDEALETTLLSESSLATDWLRPEEEEAWAHFQ